MLATGERLPKLDLVDQEGTRRKLADLSGKKGLVLFVYTKAGTSGCSKEAAEFQLKLEEFKSLGYGVAGLSRDPQAAQARFAAKLELAYPLLSDPETRVLQALGAWGEKKSKGKVTEGPVRSTFVADAKGKLVKTYAKVKAAGHAEAVLADLTP